MSAPLAVRERVLGFVLRYPGAHPRAIERELGLSDRLAAHHLDALAEEGAIDRFEDGGFARYVARERAARLTEVERRHLVLVRRPPCLRIMLLLATQRELSQGDVSARLGLAKASTSYHLQALVEAGIVAARAEGRHRYYALRDARRTTALLEEFGALPGDLDEFSRMWNDLFS